MSKKIDVNEYHEMRVQSDYWGTEFNKKDKECAELKQQLAKLQEKYDACQEARKLEIEFKNQEFDEHIQELIKMEKKLTEKDKEIKEYKKLMRILLNDLVFEEQPDIDLIAEVICRYAEKLGFVKCENNIYSLTEKGEKLWKK